VKSTDDSLCSGPQRDRRNQRRVTLWAFAWGAFFVAVTQGIRREWLPFGVALAGVIATALLGIATVLAYRRFLQETDELRRKIEVEALAFAFGAGIVGGLTYWQLVVSGAAPATGFSYVFVAMILAHPVGVLIGHRRYS
jgi:fluoride ion exporter CrcB/FEX